MSLKSDVLPLPIQFKDDKKYSDVVDILASYEATFQTIFKTACDDEGLDRETYIPVYFNCPSGGDQLKRLQFTLGHKLQTGGHKSKDRLEHTQPDEIELFHTKQAFLTVSISQNMSYNDYVINASGWKAAYHIKLL